MPIYRTCEFVTPMHPDKLCDQIADAIVDAHLSADPESRVAVEALGGHKHLTISGEITSQASPSLQEIAQRFVGPDYSISIICSRQSPEIAHGVDTGGAGDQGIMVGYATTETPELLPQEYVLSRRICKKLFKQFPYDGKVQVTIDSEGQPTAVVASFQNATHEALEAALRKSIDAERYFANPAGDWSLGGFDADSGLTGRKIVIDNYGPRIGIGGGAFSGKDWTKVDRSGAYMARRIAVDTCRHRGAREVLVKLAYIIGEAQPVMARIVLDGKEEEIQGYDLSPRGIRERLGLSQPQFEATARWGHFGNGFVWDAPTKEES